jgi:hypothetical protein
MKLGRVAASVDATAASAREADVGAEQPAGPGPAGATSTGSHTRWLAVAAVFAAGCAALWIGVATGTAGHGLDTSDEGAYLLSYRWWSVNLRTFTGAQYLYGPVFEVFGYDIAALRLFRLVTVVAVHLAFGWAFMRWLRQRRPAAPASRLWEAAGTAAILAAGGMVYGWLPLSPGYNDVSLLCGLLAAALVLRAATLVGRGVRVPAWVGVALGPVAVAAILAKWTSSALTIVVVAAAGILVAAPRGWRELVRLASWALAGVLVTLGLIQLFVVPLTSAVTQMLTINQLVAAKTNSPAALLHMYATTGWQVAETVGRRGEILLVAAVFAVVTQGRLARWCAAVLAVLGLGLSTRRLILDGDWQGGTVNLGRYPVGVLLVLAVAVVIGLSVLLRDRYGSATRAAQGMSGPVKRPEPHDGWAGPSSLSREGRAGWAILVMLALIPVTQATGTGNPLYYMAVNGYAAWLALIIVVVTGVETAPRLAHWLAAAMAAGAVLLSTSIAVNGLWSHPYRTAPVGRTTTVPAEVPALASIRLDPDTARRYSRLHDTLQPYLRPPGRAIMAFDEMAGIVLLLDGRSVGEAWYSASDHDRTAAGIRADCPGGRGWWGSRAPILIFRRPATSTETNALRSCGLDFTTDYRLVGPKEDTMDLLVYVPAAGAGQ